MNQYTSTKTLTIQRLMSAIVRKMRLPVHVAAHGNVSVYRSLEVEERSLYAEQSCLGES